MHKQEEEAAVIIHAFLRTTLVRVKLKRTIRLCGPDAKALDWVRTIHRRIFNWIRGGRIVGSDEQRGLKSGQQRKHGSGQKLERGRKE